MTYNMTGSQFQGSEQPRSYQTKFLKQSESLRIKDSQFVNGQSETNERILVEKDPVQDIEIKKLNKTKDDFEAELKLRQKLSHTYGSDHFKLDRLISMIQKSQQSHDVKEKIISIMNQLKNHEEAIKNTSFQGIEEKVTEHVIEQKLKVKQNLKGEKEKLTNLQQENETLKIQIKLLKHDLSKYKVKNQKFQTEVECLKAYNSQLEEEVMHYEDAVQEFTPEEGFERESGPFKKGALRQKVLLSALDENKLMSQMTEEIYEQQIEGLMKKLKLDEQQIKQIQSKNLTQISKICQKYEISLLEKNNQIKDLVNAIQFQNQSVRLLAKDISTVDDKNNQHKMSTLESSLFIKNQKISSQMKNLKKYNCQLKQQILRYEQIIDEIPLYQEQNFSLADKEFLEVEKTSKFQVEKVVQLQKSLAELKIQVEQKNQDLSKQKVKNKKLSAEMGNLREYNSQIEEENIQYEDAIDELTKEKEQLMFFEHIPLERPQDTPNSNIFSEDQLLFEINEVYEQNRILRSRIEGQVSEIEDLKKTENLMNEVCQKYKEEIQNKNKELEKIKELVISLQKQQQRKGQSSIIQGENMKAKTQSQLLISNDRQKVHSLSESLVRQNCVMKVVFQKEERFKKMLLNALFQFQRQDEIEKDFLESEIESLESRLKETKFKSLRNQFPQTNKSEKQKNSKLISSNRMLEGFNNQINNDFQKLNEYYEGELSRQEKEHENLFFCNKQLKIQNTVLIEACDSLKAENSEIKRQILFIKEAESNEISEHSSHPQIELQSRIIMKKQKPQAEQFYCQEQMNEKRQNLEQASESIQQRFEALADKNEVLEEKLKQIESQYQAKNSEFEKNFSIISTLENQKKNLEQKYENEKTRFTIYESKIEGINEEIETMKKQIDRLIRYSKQKQTQNDLLKCEVQKLNKFIQEEQSQVNANYDYYENELQQILQMNSQKIIKLEENHFIQRQKLEQQIYLLTESSNQLKQKLKIDEKNDTDLHFKNGQFTQQINILKQNIANLESKVKQLEEETVDKRRKQSQMNEQIKKLENNNVFLTIEIKDILQSLLQKIKIPENKASQELIEGINMIQIAKNILTKPNNVIKYEELYKSLKLIKSLLSYFKQGQNHNHEKICQNFIERQINHPQDLNQRNQQLNQQRHQMGSEQEARDQQFRDKQQNISGLRRKISEKQEIIQSISEKNNFLKQQNQFLSKNIQKYQKQVTELINKSQGFKISLSQISNCLNKQKQKSQKLIEQNKSVSRQMEQWKEKSLYYLSFYYRKNQKGEKMQKMMKKDYSYDELCELVLELQEKVQQAETKLIKIQINHEEDEKKFEILEQQIIQEKRKNQKAEKKLSELSYAKGVIREYEIKMGELFDQFDRLQEIVMKLKRDKTDASTKNSLMAKDIEMLNYRNKTLERELNSLQLEKSRQSAELQSLRQNSYAQGKGVTHLNQKKYPTVYRA